VEAVVANLVKNVVTAKDVLRRAIPQVKDGCRTGCPTALRDAVITSPTQFPPATRRRLDLLLGRYFPKGHPRADRRHG
jgi:5'-methylthioadenosine phosphorylase